GLGGDTAPGRAPVAPRPTPADAQAPNDGTGLPVPGAPAGAPAADAPAPCPTPTPDTGTGTGTDTDTGTGAEPTHPGPAADAGQPAGAGSGAATGGATGTGAGAGAPVRSAGPGRGWNFDGIPAVGRMYSARNGGRYFCTASVVSSPGRNLVVTAAHCLTGADTRQLYFVPKYTAAKPQPYGKFPVRRIWIDPRYRRLGPNKGARLDVAFVEVGPRPDGRRVEAVVGGNRLVTGSAYAQPGVMLVGHPAGAARPRACVNRTTRFTSRDPKIPGTFLRINCTGYPGGTSGGPFIAAYDSRTRTGSLIGVIGGWKTGGDLPDTSYSSYFGADVKALYAAATRGRT
ncbi:trypsin-like serine peptidase, partial [Streptomyces antimicrobicus]